MKKQNRKIVKNKKILVRKINKRLKQIENYIFFERKGNIYGIKFIDISEEFNRLYYRKKSLEFRINCLKKKS